MLKQTIRDLTAIGKVVIDDLQFIIEVGTGSVYVIDPLVNATEANSRSTGLSLDSQSKVMEFRESLVILLLSSDKAEFAVIGMRSMRIASISE